MQKRILICDDDLDILEVTSTILKLRGYVVETANHLVDVVELVNRVKPHVILMDIWIPDIGGEEATRRLKAHQSTARIPVVFFSANNDIAKVAQKVGVEAFLPKPFEISDLEDLIENLASKFEIEAQ